MRNNKIMLTESKLRSMIAEATKRTLQEMEGIGMSSDVYDRVQEMKEIQGPEALLDAIIGKIDERQLSEILDTVENVDWQMHADDEDDPYEDENI